MLVAASNILLCMCVFPPILCTIPLFCVCVACTGLGVCYVVLLAVEQPEFGPRRLAVNACGCLGQCVFICALPPFGVHGVKVWLLCMVCVSSGLLKCLCVESEGQSCLSSHGVSMAGVWLYVSTLMSA